MAAGGFWPLLAVQLLWAMFMGGRCLSIGLRQRLGAGTVLAQYVTFRRLTDIEQCSHVPPVCCEFATEKCAKLPPVKELSPGHKVACWFAEDVRDGTKERTGPYPAPGEDYEKEKIEL